MRFLAKLLLSKKWIIPSMGVCTVDRDFRTPAGVCHGLALWVGLWRAGFAELSNIQFPRWDLDSWDSGLWGSSTLSGVDRLQLVRLSFFIPCVPPSYLLKLERTTVLIPSIPYIIP